MIRYSTETLLFKIDNSIKDPWKLENKIIPLMEVLIVRRHVLVWLCLMVWQICRRLSWLLWSVSPIHHLHRNRNLTLDLNSIWVWGVFLGGGVKVNLIWTGIAHDFVHLENRCIGWLDLGQLFFKHPKRLSGVVLEQGHIWHLQVSKSDKAHDVVIS